MAGVWGSDWTLVTDARPDVPEMAQFLLHGEVIIETASLAIWVLASSRATG
ncbi:hypothetical protein [Paraburkholderia ultramafica]|uniref:hypothetical protein n=1 Tax=Paraburkholderia ultramafica TaxID=1544867 RepID=UPI00158219B1|nr:hypothetical protein [Paraburkholderia ultramafica]